MRWICIRDAREKTLALTAHGVRGFDARKRTSTLPTGGGDAWRRGRAGASRGVRRHPGRRHHCLLPGRTRARAEYRVPRISFGDAGDSE